MHPEVFPPHYTISTKILLDFIDGLDIDKKSLLELGCGSGIISLLLPLKEPMLLQPILMKKALKS